MSIATKAAAKKGKAYVECADCQEKRPPHTLVNGRCRACRKYDDDKEDTRAYEYRLYPTAAQEKELRRAAEMSRQWWNFLIGPALDARRVEKRHYAQLATAEEAKLGRELTKDERKALWKQAEEGARNECGGTWRELLAKHLDRPYKELVAELRAQRPWWGLPSNMLNAVHRTAREAAKAQRAPRAKKRGESGQLELPGPTHGAKPLEGRDGEWWLRVPNCKPNKGTRPEDVAVHGLVRVRRHRRTPSMGQLRSVRLSRRGKQWYVSMVYKTPPRAPNCNQPMTCIGVDRGVRWLAALSDPLYELPKYSPKSVLSSAWTDPRMVPGLRRLRAEDRATQRRARADARIARLIARQHPDASEHVRRRATKVHKWGDRSAGELPSKRYQRVLAAEAAAKAEGTFARREVRRLLADKLTKTARIIVFEALETRSMSKRKIGAGAQGRGLNRAILLQGWGELKLATDSAAGPRGCIIIEVPPAHTSQTCASCGHLDAESREDERYVCTACGHVDHADRNAAVNIRDRGAAYLLEECDPRQSARLSAEEKADLARTTPSHAIDWAKQYKAELTAKTAAAQGRKPQRRSQPQAVSQ